MKTIMLAQWLLQWKIITIAQESSLNVGNVGDKVPHDPVDHLSDEELELAIAREEERQARLRKRISRGRDKKRLHDLQQGTKRLADEVYALPSLYWEKMRNWCRPRIEIVPD